MTLCSGNTFRTGGIVVSVYCESAVQYVIDALKSWLATVSLDVIVFLHTFLLHTMDVWGVYHIRRCALTICTI